MPVPRQERSRRTLERILAAAELLLVDRDFEELTMADLAAEAGCAVGSLYDRIPGKEALLHCLFDLLGARAETTAVGLERAESDLSLRARAERVIDEQVRLCTELPGIVRAMALRLYRAGPDGTSFRASATRSFRRTARFLAAAGDEIRHEDPALACELALLTTLGTVQNRLLFGARSGVKLNLGKQRLRDELVRMLLAYLQG